MTILVALPDPVRARARDPIALNPGELRGVRVLLRPEATHLGHWNPTDAAFMHSPQMGWWQRWQEIPV